MSRGTSRKQRERRRGDHELGAARGAARAPQRARASRRKCSGIGPTSSPRTSLICSVAMTVAMPVVKPVVTGYGMNWMRRPSRATPIATSMTPGHAARR